MKVRLWFFALTQNSVKPSQLQFENNGCVGIYFPLMTRDEMNGNSQEMEMDPTNDEWNLWRKPLIDTQGIYNKDAWWWPWRKTTEANMNLKVPKVSGNCSYPALLVAAGNVRILAKSVRWLKMPMAIAAAGEMNCKRWNKAYAKLNDHYPWSIESTVRIYQWGRLWIRNTLLKL